MFIVDNRISITLDPVLAQQLADRMLEPRGENNKLNPSIYSFGRQLRAVSIGEAPKKVVKADETEGKFPIFSVKMEGVINTNSTISADDDGCQRVEIGNFKVVIKLSERFCELVAKTILNGFCENNSLVALAKKLDAIFAEDGEEGDIEEAVA